MYLARKKGWCVTVYLMKQDGQWPAGWSDPRDLLQVVYVQPETVET